MTVHIPPEGTQGFSHPPLSGNCAPPCGFTFFPNEWNFELRGCSRGCSKRVFKGVQILESGWAHQACRRHGARRRAAGRRRPARPPHAPAAALLGAL